MVLPFNFRKIVVNMVFAFVLVANSVCFAIGASSKGTAALANPVGKPSIEDKLPPKNLPQKKSSGGSPSASQSSPAAVSNQNSTPNSKENLSVLFDGYSKIFLGGEHKGFIAQKYEFDKVRSEFISTYYLKLVLNEKTLVESLRARANSGLSPISYQYIEIDAGKSKTIDAQFHSGEMTAKINVDGKIKTVQKKVPKGSFLSTFLVYLMVQSKDGIKTGVNYTYNAFAEEDAELLTGSANIVRQERMGNIEVFRVQNTFKNVRFESWVTKQGEVLATNTPQVGIKSELVADKQTATGNLRINPDGPLKALFGEIPSGTENVIARGARHSQPSHDLGAVTSGAGLNQGADTIGGSRDQDGLAPDMSAPRASHPSARYGGESDSLGGGTELEQTTGQTTANDNWLEESGTSARASDRASEVVAKPSMGGAAAKAIPPRSADSQAPSQSVNSGAPSPSANSGTESPSEVPPSVLKKRKILQQPAPVDPETPKKSGVPGGKGMILKQDPESGASE